MANISTTQNLPRNIQRLAAQRHLYSRAKQLSTLQPLLAGVTSIAGAVAIVISTEVQPWIALAGILVPLINTGWLERWQDCFRRAAADIQEDFDCNVLDLPWNAILAGHRPTAEDVHEAAKKATPSTDTPLENWYPAIVDSLPLHQARVICQRINCRWDSKLRRRYRCGIVTALILISGSVFFLGFLTGMNLQKFVLAVAAPLSPTLLWGIREARRQEAAAAALDRLRDFVEGFWMEVSRNKLTESTATSRSRDLQNEILSHRRANPLVFDWIYRYQRRKYEEQMNVSAEDMVAQINAA